MLAIVAVFAFARPEYRAADASEMIDFSTRHYYSPDTVRSAFAEQGIRLRVTSTFYGLVSLSNVRPPVRAEALQVNVGPRTSTGSWGPELEPYDERFGNLLVTYGDDDEALLEKVEAAVVALRYEGLTFR